jgi:uncharacterized membrane protein
LSGWVGVLGRLHPLVLHLPIGALAALVLLEAAAMARRSPSPRVGLSPLVFFAAVTAVLAAATGYTLSREEGYAGPTLGWHLRLGIAVAISTVALAACWARSRAGARGGALAAYRIFLAVSIGLLVPAGHFGSTITHGEGFLTQPLRPPALAEAAAAPASSYESIIAPIFASRCSGCHGSEKRKSGLALHEPEGILAGGKRGPVLVPGKPQSSRIVERLRLPEGHEDHMPPEGKPQPTEEEIRRIEAWISAGAPFDGEVEALEALGAEVGPAEVEVAEAAARREPPAEALGALERAQVHVEAVERDSGLLRIDFAAVAEHTEDAQALALLEPVRDRVEDVGLARAPVGDPTAALLARMPNLRRADLRATAVTDEGIAAIAGHERLEELVLAQTSVGDGAIETLLSLPSLRRLYLWKSRVTDEGARRLATGRPALRIDVGESGEAAVLEAEEEVRLGAPAGGAAPGSLEPVNAKCPVSGKPVDTAFRAIHRGRVVGFCCAQCPATFWADPAKYESKIP